MTAPTAFDSGLRRVAAAIGLDLLDNWKAKVWHLQDDGSYRADTPRQRCASPSDVAAHLRGEQTIAVAPISRAVVIDTDLCAKTEKPPEDVKQRAAEAVSLVLDTFGIPFLTFDSARGTHTWVRLPRNVRPDERAALDALIRPHVSKLVPKRGERDCLEVFPDGGKAIRLPLGLYRGERRRPLNGMSDAETLRWLIQPDRATEDQVAALVEAAKHLTQRPQAKTAIAQTAPRPPRAADGLTARSTTLDPPAPIRRWERWTPCKQRLAVEGPPTGRRHDSILTLANEAATCGETDPATLEAFLLAVPVPNSSTSESEHLSDVRAAVRSALRLQETKDPRRYSGCGADTDHSGLPEGSRQRGTFAHYCDDEAQAVCPIHRAKKLGLVPPPWAIAVLKSSLWGDTRGNGRGLGFAAKDIYRIMLGQGGHDPERVFAAALTWLHVRLLNQGLRVRHETVVQARKQLHEEGLIELVDAQPGKPHTFRVPVRDADWLRQKESQLGTHSLARREMTGLLKRWDKLDSLDNE